MSTIGYTTTAKYRGQLSRITVGRTEFTAHFIGIPIVTPAVGVSPTTTEADEAIAEEAPAPQPTHTQSPESIHPPGPAVIESLTVEQVHVGGIVIETEQQPQHEAVDMEDGAEQENETRGLTVSGIIRALLFAASVVLAYFVGKKGKAMLDVLKRASCVIVAAVMVFGISQTAVAAELPDFGFGRRDNLHAIHFNNFASASQHSPVAVRPSCETVIHFDPRRTDITPGAVNLTHASPSSAPRADPASNYGDTIGILTVERLGRTVSVIAGATMSAMDYGAAHFSFTGLNRGNTALIGHNRGRSNGFFDFVRHLREGDILALEAGGVTRRYAVTMMYVIDYTDFSPLAQFGDNRLTLITCVEYRQTKRRVAAAVEIIE